MVMHVLVMPGLVLYNTLVFGTLGLVLWLPGPAYRHPARENLYRMSWQERGEV